MSGDNKIKYTWREGRAIVFSHVWFDFALHKQEDGFLDTDAYEQRAHSKGTTLSAIIHNKDKAFKEVSFWVVFNFGKPVYVLFKAESFIMENTIYRAIDICQECDLSQELKDQAFSALTAYPLGISGIV